MNSNGRFWKAKGGRANDAIPSARVLQDEAMAWVQTLTSGLAEAEDRAAFLRWRDQSPAHLQALIEARDLWTDLGPALVADQERQVADQFSRSLADTAGGRRRPTGRRGDRLQPQMGRRRLSPTLQRVAAACAVAVLGMGGAGYLSSSPFSDLKTTSLTDTALLADGSRVTLAPSTAMDVDIRANGERRIDLQKGEALFDVAHDPSRPFVIRSGEGEIRVLGTAFSVRRTGGMTQVIVTRGKVAVASGNETRELTPDRMVVYGLTTMGSVRAVDAAMATGWTQDRLVFENQTVGAVIAELDRFDPRKVVLMNREVSGKRVNAVIDLKRADQWLAALEQSEGVQVTHLPGLVLIR